MSSVRGREPSGAEGPKDRPGVRDALALLLSLLVHALPVVLGLIPALALRLLPKPPIEMEILPPKPKPRPAAAPATLPPEVPAAATPPRAERGPGPRPGKPKPVPPPAVQKMDLSKGRLGGLGPSAIDHDIGLRVLLRMPLLRQSPHRSTVEALLHAFPDTHILAAGTSLASPPARLGAAPGSAPSAEPGPMAKALIDDVDGLFIATADPRDITATVFYAALRAGEGPGLADKLAARKSPRWDTRSVVTLRPGLLAFARPDLIGPVDAPPPGAAPSGPPPPPAPPDPAWTERLQETLQRPGPALYAEILNVQGRIRLRNGLPTPVAVRLALSGDADPEVHARIEMATPEEAAQLYAALPDLRSSLSGRLFWVGLGGLLGGLKLQSRPSAVEITGRLPRGDTAVLLAWVRGFLPPPERFLDPPPPPPPVPDGAAEAPPDLGAATDAGHPSAP